MSILAISYLGIFLFCHVAALCPSGFSVNKDHCYKVLALEASWIEARHYCTLLGANLAIIESQSEETAIEGILTTLHGSHIDETYWIGGTDIVGEKDWRWMIGNGVSVPITNYTNWGLHRPDNIGGNENCLTIGYRHGRTSWNDKNCQEQHSFICGIKEKEVEGSTLIVG